MHRRKPQRPQLKKCSSKPVSSQAVCSKKICFWGLFQFCSRALGPPRLAAGAGDRQSETLTNIYNLAPSGCFSKRFPLLTATFSNPQAPAGPFIRKDLFRLRACLRHLGRFWKSITTNRYCLKELVSILWRAGGVAFNGRQGSPAQVHQKSKTFSKFLGSSGGRADRGSPRQKTFQVTFKKNLDFFPVSLCRLNPKFTKFLADLPNFLRLYRTSQEIW